MSKARKPGEVVSVNGVKIVGYINVPGRLAGIASALYAKNLLHLPRNPDRQEREEACGQLGR